MNDFDKLRIRPIVFAIAVVRTANLSHDHTVSKIEEGISELESFMNQVQVEHRIIGSGDLWVSEYALTYDNQPLSCGYTYVAVQDELAGVMRR
jgi:hypothetical protein